MKIFILDHKTSGYVLFIDSAMRRKSKSRASEKVAKKF